MHVRVGVLLDQQRGRGMPDEQGQQPVAGADVVEPARTADV